MQRFLSLCLAVLALMNSSCSFDSRPQEPRELKGISHPGFTLDETKLNATYSYLVFLYHNNQGEGEDARRALDKALVADPESSALKLEHAQDLYMRGLYASAREQLNKVKEENSEAEKLFIQILIREGNLSEARVSLDKWLAKNDKDEDFFSLRARIEIEEQNIPAAEKVIQRFLASLPDSSQAYLLRGRVRQIQDREKEALNDYKNALQIDPQNVSAAAHLAFLQDMSGKSEEALQTYAWLAELTDNPEFHKRLGSLYVEKSDARKAIAALEAYARHKPNDHQNLAKLAGLYIELRDYEQAEYKLKDLVKMQPENEALRYYYAAALFELNKKARALAEIRKIQKDSSLYPERVRIELQSLWDLGQTANAQHMAEGIAGDVIVRSEVKDEALYPILYSFMAQNKMKPFAKRVLSKGLELFPLSSQLRYSHALSLDEDGKVKEALILSQALLKEDSKNPALQNLVGYLLANQGIELKRAERLIEEALTSRPTDAFIMDSKAWVKYKQNRYDEALVILEQANKLKPDEPIILIHLGDVLAKLGRIQEAVSQYEKAIALGIDPAHERIRVQEIVSKMQEQPARKISCSPGTLCSPE